MRMITAVLAAVGMFGALTASAPARADEYDFDGGWRRQEWREHHWREQRWQEQRWQERERRERAWHAYAPPPGAYAPPGYYAPQPAYAPPPPAYYAPPPPVYYAPPQRQVIEGPSFSIGFGFR